MSKIVKALELARETRRLRQARYETSELINGATAAEPHRVPPATVEEAIIPIGHDVVEQKIHAKSLKECRKSSCWTASNWQIAR